MELPNDVANILLRGLTLYINATPTNELPPEVRRFKGFRPAALTKHRANVLGLLESEAQRGLILQWLDEDKPSLSKDQQAALRLACQQPDGWADELVGMSRPARGKKEENQVASDPRVIERERDKTRKARAEARAVKTEMDSLVARHASEVAETKRQIASLEAALEEQTKRAEQLQNELDGVRTTSEREVRRAKSRLKASEEEMKELKAELRRLKPDPIEKAPAAPEPRRSRKPRSGPRKPLKVPSGRRDDEVATLEGWLRRDDVQLLVDGYNVTMVAYPGVSLETQRDRLVKAVRELAARHSVPATIVFDGAEGTGIYPRRGKIDVRVVFSKEGAIADDTLIEILEGFPPTPVIVVTNDRELRDRARKLGATIAFSEQLLGTLR